MLESSYSKQGRCGDTCECPAEVPDLHHRAHSQLFITESHRTMGKAAILIIAASIAMGSMYSLAAKDDARQAEARLSTHQYEVLARNAALAGYNRAKQALTDDFAGAPTELNGTYAGSDYEVEISKNGGVAGVTTTGTATTADGTDVNFKISSTIEEEWFVKMAEEAPPFMRYALLSNGDLALDGNVLADLYVDGNAENTLNANMHTNGSLILSGNSVNVKGFGTYVDAAIATPASALQNAFDPYYNPTNGDVTQQVAEVDVPPFDVTDFFTKVSPDETTSGPVNLSGTYDLGGTREDPYVWHIQGDLSSSGGANIKGYVMFVVEGNVTLDGNVDANQSSYDGGQESNVAYYASGTVNLGGSAQVYGQIYAGTGVTFLTGTPKVHGSVSTAGQVLLSGTPKIYYREASPALTTVFEDLQPRYNMLTYSEF